MQAKETLDGIVEILQNTRSLKEGNKHIFFLLKYLKTMLNKKDIFLGRDIMERDGIGMISKEYSREDFIDLELNMHSDQQDWDKAIKMVKSRFYERYFDVIDTLSVDWNKTNDRTNKIISEFKVEINGFAIMALNCLLIDAFIQFKYGLEGSNERGPGGAGNRNNYIAFLKGEFSELEWQADPQDPDLAELFYDHIRCGILHSAQTKGCSKLAFKGKDIINMVHEREKDGIRVDVIKFSNVLKKHFDRYIQCLKDGNDIELRKNLIKKMKHVCDI